MAIFVEHNWVSYSTLYTIGQEVIFLSASEVAMTFEFCRVLTIYFIVDRIHVYGYSLLVQPQALPIFSQNTVQYVCCH